MAEKSWLRLDDRKELVKVRCPGEANANFTTHGEAFVFSWLDASDAHIN